MHLNLELVYVICNDKGNSTRVIHLGLPAYKHHPRQQRVSDRKINAFVAYRHRVTGYVRLDIIGIHCRHLSCRHHPRQQSSGQTAKYVHMQCISGGREAGNVATPPALTPSPRPPSPPVTTTRDSFPAFIDFLCFPPHLLHSTPALPPACPPATTC